MNNDKTNYNRHMTPVLNMYIYHFFFYFVFPTVIIATKSALKTPTASLNVIF